MTSQLIKNVFDHALLFDLSDRDEIRIGGTDRKSLMQGFCSNNVASLNVGEGKEAFVTTIQGKTLGHIFLFEEGDHFIIDTAAGQAEKLIAHWDRYVITEDVTFEQTTANRKLFLLAGQETLKVLHEWEITNLPQEANSETRTVTESGEICIRNVNWLPIPTFQISIPADSQEFDSKIQPLLCSDEDWNALRVLGGFPLEKTDFDDSNLVQEVGRTDQAVSFHKGCYLGQEPIARIDALGHVNRNVTTMAIRGSEASSSAPTVGPIIVEGKKIGKLTSITASSNPQEWFGIGTIRREYLNSEDPFQVQLEGFAGDLQIINPSTHFSGV